MRRVVPRDPIATALRRSAPTISHEVTRNKGRRQYRAVDADERAWRRARRPKTCLLPQPVAAGDTTARRDEAELRAGLGR